MFLTEPITTAVPEQKTYISSPLLFLSITSSIIICLSEISYSGWLFKYSIIESLVTPGRIKSSKSGVTIYAFLPFLLLKTKKIFEAPTSIILRSS